MKRKGERHIPDFSKKPKTPGGKPIPRPDGAAAPPATPPRPKATVHLGEIRSPRLVAG